MSDIAPAPSGPRYKFVSQIPQLVPAQGGGFVQGYVVTFMTIPGGSTFKVSVPASQYNAANVSALAAQQYQETAAIENLAG
jgi:hypothetical protein